MNNKHLKNKKTLKIIGFITLIPGIILSIVGFVSFVIGFMNMTMPPLFFLTIVGFPLIGIGSSWLSFAYRKEVNTYLKNESIPVVKEAYQDIKPEFKDLVDTIKGNDKDVITCSRCGAQNDSNNKFCNQCGNSLTVSCPLCHTTIEKDSKYCPHCGTKLH